ncbi:MAG: GPR endopeptidase [Ruminococcaceae bacterium]|nr:GPR endopeptidase [Oscillospiraceae bacterium]
MYGYYTERDYKGDFPYTDLATERRRADVELAGVEYKREQGIIGEWEKIKITTKKGAESIGRPIGIYDTLNIGRMDLLDGESIIDARDEVARELCYMLDASDIFPERILVAGLGNPALTPDSVGAEAAKAVKPTMHIREMNKRLFEDLNCAEIAVCSPGVAATSGLDAAVTIRGLCEALGPDAVIVVDALASRSPERLGTTVQICNTGIAPGSGLGNPRQPISIDTVGVPVIAIGVPTVIDSRMFYYNPNGERRPKPEICPSMFVSPKEINDIVSAAALIIGGGINQAFGIY